MTSPPRKITVECPKCGHLYQDWTRASVNLDLDDFDEEYLEQCSTATCPECHYKIDLDVLIVEDGVFKFEAPGSDANVADWGEGFAQLTAYVQAEGTALVPGQHRTIDGYPLGRWVNKQRNRKERDRLSAGRRQRLDAVDGWVWNVRVDDWEEGFGHLVAYVEAEGHARVPFKHQTAEGYPLGQWVDWQRYQFDNDSLLADHRQRLDAIDEWVWDANVADWEEGFAQLTAYAQANGSARVPKSHRTAEGFYLGGWVGRQRSDKDRLSADRRQRLEALKGWVWDAAWEDGIEHLVAYVQANGSARVRRSHRTADGYQLEPWVGTQRAMYKKGRLSEDRIQRLEALPGWVWDANIADREDSFTPLP